MSAPTEEKREIGRALSALLQCLVGQQVGGEDAAIGALLTEYGGEILTPMTPAQAEDMWRKLWTEMTCAALVLIRHCHEEHGADPHHWLPPLVRAQRKEDRS